MAASDSLSQLYGALAHPVRRAILGQLARGDARVGDIAVRFAITPPAITNHVRVLEEAGLVKRRAVAQTRILSLEPAALRKGEEWLGNMREFWKASFDRLDAHLVAGPRSATRRKKRRR